MQEPIEKKNTPPTTPEMGRQASEEEEEPMLYGLFSSQDSQPPSPSLQPVSPPNTPSSTPNSPPQPLNCSAPPPPPNILRSASRSSSSGLVSSLFSSSSTEKDEVPVEEEEEIPEDEKIHSMFTTICPYNDCNALIDLRAFPKHAITIHYNDSFQRLACPLCFLLTGQEFAPNDNTHLAGHCENAHGDFMNPDATPLGKAVDARKLAAIKKSQDNSGLRESKLGSLPTAIFDPNKEEHAKLYECTICLCEYEEGEEMVELQCSHTFHSDCIKDW
eukprot:CAMPEP_0174272002 /NCGR_PEP_ID=MMETSP0439-20130205/49746_1 /TAXON_ID=0 /ORGANISM="Stereomyxa ramosa, Strain Chinc5" /LENGTH=273 /DNA_ID=CAMNT_0015362323 /DNA_START=1 /DNA_END=819 /DNA_ORIENTATION=+